MLTFGQVDQKYRNMTKSILTIASRTRSGQCCISIILFFRWSNNISESPPHNQSGISVSFWASIYVPIRACKLPFNIATLVEIGKCSLGIFPVVTRFNFSVPSAISDLCSFKPAINWPPSNSPFAEIRVKLKMVPASAISNPYDLIFWAFNFSHAAIWVKKLWYVFFILWEKNRFIYNWGVL